MIYKKDEVAIYEYFYSKYLMEIHFKQSNFRVYSVLNFHELNKTKNDFIRQTISNK